MRSLKKISIAAALAGVLFVGTSSIPLAQQTDDLNELNKRALELYRAGRYSDAIQVAQRVLAIREKALGRDHPDVAQSLNNLAVMYDKQGRIADAEPLYQRSLAIREKALGRDHPDVATSLNNLAQLYGTQGRYADAEPLYQRSLDIREKAFGRDHPDVARSLNNLALLYRNQGRYADAEPLYRRSLAIWEKALGRDHPDVATSLNNLAQLYHSQGRYADAEPLYQRSLDIREKALGRDHPDVAASLNNLAGLYHRQGRYADAEPLYRRSLAIFEKARGRDSDVAQSLNNLAFLYMERGRYTDAEPLYQRSLEISEKVLGRDHPNVATTLNNLAQLYDKQGRYADAEPLYRRSLDIREKVLGRDHPDVATPLHDLALLYRNQGRYADAEPLYRRSLAIWEKVLGPDHPYVATTLTNLAEVYRNQGRYADAEPLHRRSLDIREKALGRDHPDVARSLNNLALLYRSQARYADAEPLYQRSLAISEKVLGRDHPDVARALNNLAQVYGDQGRYADAEPLYQRSLAILEKAFGRDHPDVALSLNNLAVLYRSQGRYADAEPLFQRSLAIFEKVLGRDHPDVALSLSNLAQLYGIQGRIADAEPLYRRSLTIREQALGRDHPDIATSLNNLAYLYMERARYVDALPIIRRTIQQHTANKIVALPVLFQSQAQNLVSTAQALTDSYEIVQRASSSAAANAVSQLAARFAAGTGELAQLVRSDQDLTGEAERLDKVVVAFVSKPPAERSATAEDKIRRRIEAVKAERDRLHQIFGQRFPDYVTLSKPQPVSLQETQRLLADEEALLLFDLGAKSYAWIITRTEADWTELKVSGRDLDAQVRALRSSLTDARQRFDPELAYKIYQATFGAFADKVASKKRLLIVTNGALTSLPPQLLVTKDPTDKKLKEVDWLVRSHAITILPSVANLKALRQFAKSIATKSYVAFGNPLVLGPDGTDTGAWDRQQCPKDAPASAQRVAHASTQLRDISSFFRGNLADVAEVQKLAALPETTDELCAVARRLDVPESEIWLGKRATERNIKEMSEQGRLASYRIVHFATHGLIAGELKGLAEPALVLTPPAEANDTDDGLLTASEVAQLKLNADWIVLSACNTAAAGPQGAEALSGLARAFFYAGARALLVSHWPVNSDAAVRLTTKAFAELRANPKIGRAEAMRRSMLDVITRGTDQEVHPAYWAPFVVVGEGGG